MTSPTPRHPSASRINFALEKAAEVLVHALELAKAGQLPEANTEIFEVVTWCNQARHSIEDVLEVRRFATIKEQLEQLRHLRAELLDREMGPRKKRTIRGVTK